MRIKIPLIFLLLITFTGCQSKPEPDKQQPPETVITSHSYIDSSIDIGLDQAQEIALKDGGEILNAYKACENSQNFYDIEVLKDNIKFKYKILSNGEIMSLEQEEYRRQLSSSEAREALNEYAEDSTTVESSLNSDGTCYKITIYKDGNLYKAEVDAYTGEVISFLIKTDKNENTSS